MPPEPAMASFMHHVLGIFILAALCNSLGWIGPAPTAFESPESTALAPAAAPAPIAPKPTLLRRATSALSICGFESGQAREPCGLLKACS